MSVGICRYATCVIPISAFFAASLWYVGFLSKIEKFLLAFLVFFAYMRDMLSSIAVIVNHLNTWKF